MLSLVFATSLVMGGADVDVALLDGTSAEGRLVRLTEEGLEIDGVSGDSFALKSLLTVTAQEPAEPPIDPPTIRVDLVDDSQLLAAGYRVSDGKAEISLVGGGSVAVPTRSVGNARFQLQDADVLRQWKEIAASDLEGDVLVVRKTVQDDEAGAAPTYSLDYLEGVLYDVTDTEVQFDYDGDRVKLARAKVEGLIYFHPPGRELPATICAVQDSVGSRFNTKAVQADEQSLQLTLACGPAVALSVANLRQLDFSAGRIVFLSDLEPTSVEWNSFLDVNRTLPSLAQLYHPRTDRSFSGTKLKVRVKRRVEEFAKGLAIHSRTSMIYRLPPDVQRFQALAGIDEAVRAGGNVRLVIRGDNRVLLDEVVAADAEPVPVDVAVTGVERLKILVDFGESMDIGDSLHLCNARLTK